MIEILAEVVVREGSSGSFELAYGPGGAWERLASRSPGFRGSALLRDARNPGRYLVVEMWAAEDDRQAAVRERSGKHHAFEESVGLMVESRTELGTFRMLGETSVRPRSSRRSASRWSTRG